MYLDFDLNKTVIRKMTIIAKADIKCIEHAQNYTYARANTQKA